MSSDQAVDKEHLYGVYEKGKERQRQLADEERAERQRKSAFFMDVTAKALDMAPAEHSPNAAANGDDDDMHLHVENKSARGMTWRELLAIGGLVLASLALLIGALLAGAILCLRLTQPVAPVQPQPGPVDTEYEVLFYDRNRNPIDVEPLPDD